MIRERPNTGVTGLPVLLVLIAVAALCDLGHRFGRP